MGQGLARVPSWQCRVSFLKVRCWGSGWPRGPGKPCHTVQQKRRGSPEAVGHRLLVHRVIDAPQVSD
jgi:hypothetical protein